MTLLYIYIYIYIYMISTMIHKSVPFSKTDKTGRKIYALTAKVRHICNYVIQILYNQH